MRRTSLAVNLRRGGRHSSSISRIVTVSSAPTSARSRAISCAALRISLIWGLQFKYAAILDHGRDLAVRGLDEPLRNQAERGLLSDGDVRSLALGKSVKKNDS